MSSSCFNALFVQAVVFPSDFDGVLVVEDVALLAVADAVGFYIWPNGSPI